MAKSPALFRNFSRWRYPLTRLRSIIFDYVPGITDFWCRIVDDELLFFFGHPATRGLTYPMRYAQSAQAVPTRREVRLNCGGSVSELELVLEFERYQSLLLRVSKTGRVEQLDISYIPPDLNAE